MAKQHYWFKFEWQIWRTDPALRRCSLETRGFWIECLCVMYDTKEYFLEGAPAALANLIGCDSRKFARCVEELSREKAASVSKSQEIVRIVSRRLLKAVNHKEYNRIKKAESRCQTNVKPKSRAISKDIEIKSLKVKNKSKKKKEEKNTPQAAVSVPSDYSILMRHHAKRIGTITNGAAQGKAIKHILEKFSTRDATGCYDYQVSQLNQNGGWRDKVNWLTVWSDISEWITAGRPERWVKNGNRTTEREKSAERGSNAEDFADRLERLAESRELEISGDDGEGNPPVNQLGERSLVN